MAERQGRQSFVALLRAVNVGGTSKLPMADLRKIGEDCGLEDVRTYIASGNLLFRTRAKADEVRQQLEQRIAEHMGKPVPVILRSAEEMAVVAASNPFPDEKGSRLMVSFLPQPVPADVMATVRGQAGERIATGARELYIAYGEGIGRTKLVIPITNTGTMRNMNSVEKLAELLGAGG